MDSPVIGEDDDDYKDSVGFAIGLTKDQNTQAISEASVLSGKIIFDPAHREKSQTIEHILKKKVPVKMKLFILMLALDNVEKVMREHIKAGSKGRGEDDIPPELKELLKHGRFAGIATVTPDQMKSMKSRDAGSLDESKSYQ